MKKLYWLIFFQSFWLGQMSFAQSFSPNDILLDMDFLKNRLEAIHPNPYKYISKENFYRYFDSVQTSITQEHNTTEAYLKFLTLIKQLKCGHTTLFLDARLVPPSTPDVAIKQPQYLPFDVAIIQNRVFISRNYTENKLLNHGTEILEIEGIKTTELLEELRKFNCRYGDGNNPSADMMYLQRNFSRLFYLWKKELKDVNLTISHAKSSIHKLKVSLLKLYQIYDIAAEKYPIKPTEDNSNLTYNIADASTQTGIIKIKSFEEDDNFFRESFRVETEQIFSKIEKDKIRNLIIDVRANGGGNLALMEELLSYLIQKPIAKGEISVDENTLRILQKTDPKLSVKVERLFQLQSGKFFNKNIQGILNPKENHRFEGKIFVLINSNTFSAAAFLASKLQSDADATLIGSTAGGAKNSTSAGFFTKIILPKTQFEVSLPVCNIDFKLPTTTKNDTLLHPNFEILPTPEDFISKRDIVKEFTLRIIANM